MKKNTDNKLTEREREQLRVHGLYREASIVLDHLLFKEAEEIIKNLQLLICEKTVKKTAQPYALSLKKTAEEFLAKTDIYREAAKKFIYLM